MSEGDKKKSVRTRIENSNVAEPSDVEKSGSRRKKSVLIIAYHFPPAAGQGLPGAQRAVKLTRYLPQFEWNPIVLTVKESSYPVYIQRDPESIEELPNSLAISRTGVTSILDAMLKLKNRTFRRIKAALSKDAAPKPGGRASSAKTISAGQRKGRLQALKDSITELFEMPDEAAGWIIPATLRGRSLIKAENIGAIIATGRPWSSLVIGGLLKKLTGVPLISDFRDPWMTNPFRGQHSRIKNAVDAWLERYVARQSDLVIANTDRLRLEFENRYPAQSSEKFVCIPNGFDMYEIEKSLATHAVGQYDDEFTLVHAGFLYGKRDPSILIDAVRMLIDKERIASGNLKVTLVGPRELPYSLCDYISAKGLTEYIEVVNSVPFPESLRLVASSSLALLLQPDTMTQVPSKLFENIGMGKMTLAIANRGSATDKLFSNHDLGFFADCDSVEKIADTISAARQTWEKNGRRLEVQENVRSSFDIKTRVEEIAHYLGRLSGI